MLLKGTCLKIKVFLLWLDAFNITIKFAVLSDMWWFPFLSYFFFNKIAVRYLYKIKFYYADLLPLVITTKKHKRVKLFLCPLLESRATYKNHFCRLLLSSAAGSHFSYLLLLLNHSAEFNQAYTWSLVASLILHHLLLFNHEWVIFLS